MRITIEDTEDRPYGDNTKRKSIIEIDHDDADIFDLLENIRGAVIGYGYHTQSWEEAILTMAEEYELAENQNEEDREDISQNY